MKNTLELEFTALRQSIVLITDLSEDTCIYDIDVQPHLGNSKAIAIFLVILAIDYVSDYFTLITADLIKF
ncbi:hypothetical protein TSUD_307070 [Trifolium subterraneum]|uniref:Uncharacterized protein n=1 Tax=Trifolium subterraneum TaxID=3900 RepID=A0A2Z6NDT6_TRISU|nr:hypothetical protein TSUD_307070 [Trifolium subterraneum]